MVSLRKSSEIGSIFTRLYSGTRGESAVRTVRITFFSCSTLLCLRLCMSATGAVSGSLVRKMAVPGTRWGARALSMDIRSESPIESLRVFSVKMREPRTQVDMIRNKEAPISSGSQPPEAIFSPLAARNTRSSASSGPERASAHGRFQPHMRRATM